MRDKLALMNALAPRSHSRGTHWAVPLFTLLAMSCALPSRQDLETVQALSDLGQSFNDVREVQQALQDQVDSLQLVVARQDSVIRTLSNLAGVQYPR